MIQRALKMFILALLMVFLTSSQTDSFKILQASKKSANYLALETKVSLTRMVYRLLSFNTGLNTSVGNSSAFTKVEHTINSLSYNMIAYSEDLTCIMVQRTDAGNEEVKIVDFSTPVTATVRA